MNGEHVCKSDGGSAFTSLTAPPDFDVNDMGGRGESVMVTKFKVVKVEGGEQEVAVDSWRGIGENTKSKSSCKTCLEDVVQTAEAVKTKTLETKSDLLKSLDKSNHWAFKSTSKKIVVRKENRKFRDLVQARIKGDNKLQDGKLRLGDYVYRGVKIVLPDVK